LRSSVDKLFFFMRALCAVISLSGNSFEVLKKVVMF